MTADKIALSKQSKKKGLLIILSLGIALFVWELGSTGLFDETPPLFAAAARSMHLTGDWLTPRVNGLTRFDKPPLVYWLMGFFYSIPGQQLWDPLGTWSARLPSAFSSLLMMLVLGDTLMNYPQDNDRFPRRTALITSLAFALSPLVIIWSRIAVSDALLCGTLGISLLYQWRRYVDPNRNSWSTPWVILSLAVLVKGPVAIVLTLMTLFSFGIFQKDFQGLITLIKPVHGLLLTTLISIPWYLIELFVEGKPFWDSFFGYHNFQRLTSVVNSHQQQWWFFGIILIIASLPYTPFLLIGIFQEAKSLLFFNKKRIEIGNNSLQLFAFSWLISVFFLFTLAATKLPSYWLPATPAAGIIIALSSIKNKSRNLSSSLPFLATCLIILLFAGALLFLPLWIPFINDPEMPSLAFDLLDSRIHLKGFIVLLISIIIALSFFFKLDKGRLILFQIPLVLFHLFVFLPVYEIGDRLRQLPLRQASYLLNKVQKENEPLAMVGIKKPSIHFYTGKIVLYESNDEVALTNLADRLSNERRNGWEGKPIHKGKSLQTVLLVIDKATSQYSYWKNLNPEVLGGFGVYKIWRLNRDDLEKRSNQLISNGVKPDWKQPRPERL